MDSTVKKEEKAAEVVVTKKAFNLVCCHCCPLCEFCLTLFSRRIMKLGFRVFTLDWKQVILSYDVSFRRSWKCCAPTCHSSVGLTLHRVFFRRFKGLVSRV